MASSSFRVFHITRQSFLFVFLSLLCKACAFSLARIFEQMGGKFHPSGVHNIYKKRKERKDIKLMQHESALEPFDANVHNSFYLVVTFFFIFYFIYEFFVPFFFVIVVVITSFLFFFSKMFCCLVVTVSLLLPFLIYELYPCP